MNFPHWIELAAADIVENLEEIRLKGKEAERDAEMGYEWRERDYVMEEEISILIQKRVKEAIKSLVED